MIQTRATAAMNAAQRLQRAVFNTNAYMLVDTFLIQSGKLFDKSDNDSGEFLELFERFIREASYSGRMVKGFPLRAQEYTKIVRPILAECEDVLARWRYHPKLKLCVEQAARKALLALSADFLRTTDALSPTQRAWFDELHDYAYELFKAHEVDETLLKEFIDLNYRIHDQIKPPTLHRSYRDEHLDAIQKLEVETMILKLY